MQTVVLPVLRSPMISSRWPRPIGVMRVDRLDAGLQRLVHRLAADDAGAWISMRRGSASTSGPLPSMGSPSALTTRPSRPSPTGTDEDVAGGLDRRAFLDLADDSPSPRTTAPIDSSSRFSARPSGAALELEQLVHRRVGQARHAGDAVADLEDATDLVLVSTSGCEAGEVLLERGGDVAGVDGQLCHDVGIPLSLRTTRGVGRGDGGRSRR